MNLCSLVFKTTTSFCVFHFFLFKLVFFIEFSIRAIAEYCFLFSCFCFRFCEKCGNKNIINNAMKGENFLTSCHSECGCVRLQKIDLQKFTRIGIANKYEY